MIAVDAEHLVELQLAWPTWQRYRPEIIAHPLLVICDGAIERSQWEQQLRFLEHPQVQLILWHLDLASQREKMLNGLVFAVAQHVSTPWYLKLDTDAVALRSDDWIDSQWFLPDSQGRLPAFIASPWGYTKPRDAIERLDAWGDGVEGLMDHPRLNLPAVPGNSLVTHPRIISWCFFGRTDSTRQATALCNGRLPVPSQDTFLWYVAKRRGEFFRRVPMKRYGWEHASSRKRLKQLCEFAMGKQTLPALSSADRRAPSRSVASALARAVAALAPSYGKGVLVNVIGETMRAAFEDQRMDWRLSVAPSSNSPCRAPRSSGSETKVADDVDRVDFAVLEAETRFDALTTELVHWWSRLRPGGLLAGINYGHPRDRRGTWAVSRALESFAKSVQAELILPGQTTWLLPKVRPPLTASPIVLRQRSSPANSPFSADRLAVITCLFNPADDERIDRNYSRFAAFLESQGINLWTVELAFPSSAFRLAPGERVLQLRATSRLWQKERALNLLVQELPRRYEAVAWIDGDILFGDKQWIDELCEQLTQFPIVQCWSQAEFLDEAEEVIDFRTSTARAVIEDRPDRESFQTGHPGLAWAARRELVAVRGLYDRHLTGGGDSLMAIAAFGWWQHRLLERLPPAMRADFVTWAQTWWSSISGRVGALSGTVRHLWHGSIENRLYRERWDWLRELSFDPQSDIELDPQGLWKWTGRNPELERRLPAYFQWLRDSDVATSADLARLASSINFAGQASEP
ncbi:MAG: hypothetical protein L0219_11510 [Phycisphaerales bacterium]|nr:hypothetical protein [Phycisphaerales bacterium]